MTASVYDKIAVELGRTAPAPESPDGLQWAQWIDDATMLITERAAKLKLTLPTQAKIDYVIRQAVVAHIKKPDDATQVTVSIDDGSSSRTYQSGNGRVDIADEWWDFLGLLPSTGGAFSIDTLAGASRHLPWCSANLGATYCSCGADLTLDGPIFEGGDDDE